MELNEKIEIGLITQEEIVLEEKDSSLTRRRWLTCFEAVVGIP